MILEQLQGYSYMPIFKINTTWSVVVWSCSCGIMDGDCKVIPPPTSQRWRSGAPNSLPHPHCLESTVLASSDFLVPLKGTSSAQPRAENHSFISGSALSLSLHIQSVSSEYFVLKSPEMFSPFPFMLLYYCCILSPGLLFFLTIFIP